MPFKHSLFQSKYNQINTMFIRVFFLLLAITATHQYISPNSGHCVSPFGDTCLECALGYRLNGGKCQLIQLAAEEQCGNDCKLVFLEEAINSDDLIPTGNTKLDGNNIYYIQSGTFYVARAYPSEQAQIISSFEIGHYFNFQYHGFYFTNRYLAIISQFIDSVSLKPVYYTGIKVYDFRNKNNIREQYSYRIHGQYISSDLAKGYLRVVAQGKHSDPIRHPFWYVSSSQRKDVGQENFHNYRTKDTGFTQGLDGRSTVVCSFHLNNPNPNAVRVAVFHRDEPFGTDNPFSIYPYKYIFTDNALYLPTPRQNGVTSLRMVLFDGINILPSNLQNSLLGHPYAKQFMFVNEKQDRLIIGTNSDADRTLITLMDTNLKTIIGSSYWGRIKYMKYRQNRVFWRSYDGDKQYLMMVDTDINDGSQWNLQHNQVPGFSSYFDIYQNDRIVLYKRVKNVNGDEGTQISLVNTRTGYWEYKNEYFFGGFTQIELKRRGSIFYTAGNLLSFPTSYEKQQGAIYLDVSRDQISLRGFTCYEGCFGPGKFFDMDKTVRIEDTIYHRHACGIIAVKNQNLQFSRNIETCNSNSFGPGPF